MGFRYAAIVAENVSPDLTQHVLAQAGQVRTGEASSTTLTLPDKLFPGAIVEVWNNPWCALVLPEELISQLGHDLTEIAERCPGVLVGVSVEDTSGATWHQRFEHGDLVAQYLCCDEVIERSQGVIAYPEPSEWTEQDVFGLLPQWLDLDALGELTLRGNQVTYCNARKGAQPGRRWWRLW